MAGATPSEKGKTKVGVPSKKKTNVNARTTKSVGKNKKSIQSSDVGGGGGVIGVSEIERRDLCQEASKIRDLIANEEKCVSECQKRVEQFKNLCAEEEENLANKKTLLRNKERDLLNLEKINEAKKMDQEQSFRRNTYDSQSKLSNELTSAEVNLKQTENKYQASHAELKADWRVQHNELMEEARSQAEILVDIKKGKDQWIITSRDNFIPKNSEIQKNFHWQQKHLRSKMEERRKKAVAAIEESKHCYIRALVKDHENALAEVQAHYRSIVRNNIEIINSHKNELARAEKKEQMTKKGVIELSKEGKCLNKQLQKALGDIYSLEKACNLYKTEKEALRQARARLLVEEDSLDNLMWEEEVLRQRFELMKGERDELQAQFERTISVVQQQSRLNNLLLEKQLDKLETEMEKRDGYVSEMLSQADLDHDLSRPQKNDVLFGEKKRRAEDLQVEIAQVRNSFETFLNVCRMQGGDKIIKAEHSRLEEPELLQQQHSIAVAQQR